MHEVSYSICRCVEQVCCNISLINLSSRELRGQRSLLWFAGFLRGKSRFAINMRQKRERARLMLLLSGHRAEEEDRVCVSASC